ncbi:MAG: 2-oxo acid dehydrogenase subunit E2 [Candidatus Izemoplasmatales bacterium]|nr:2-oxo acid dehydrogenase subunit E2 [Candidatus Izemoplasmatales bacterium]
MFGIRPDGKKIKTIDPIMKLTPHIMPQRNDAMVMSLYEINCKGMDEYIFAKRKEDIHLTYMDILLAAIVRVLAIRPKLNRFIMNGRVFKRNEIEVAFTIKKALKDSADETTVKLTFSGTEDLLTIHEALNKEIRANSVVVAENDTDKLAKLLTIVPNGLIKFLVGVLKWFDKHGMLPKSIIKLSPFHTSLFITNMKSIKMGYVFHHIYNFGTTSIFLSMGKEKYEPVVLDADDEKFGIMKIMKVGAVIDERICDGLYFGNSLREFKRLLENPVLMETPVEKRIEDIK